MKDLLLKYDIPFADDIFVPEIYQLMDLHKPRLLRYLLDETAEKEGQTVLRLPSSITRNHRGENSQRASRGLDNVVRKR